MYKNNFVAVVKCNGKILRERNGGSVYLPFGAEYSILLKNKDARRALVDIEVDGKNVMNGHKLILGGNESQEIKGFMRNMRKTNRFRFIKKTKEIQRHRGDRIDDGLVRVTYQFEKAKSDPINIYWNTNTDWNVWPDGKPGDGCDWTYTSNNTSATKCSSRGASDSVYYSCNLNSVKSFAPRSDEGITVKGEKITQKYHYGEIGALESAIQTIVLHLKGQTGRKKVVKKAVTVQSKFKCETCGRKNKSTNKFCYNCGTYLD